MANERRIYDTFWTDGYVQDLNPDGKLLFIYLLTNEHVEVSGVYQLTIRTITNETGLSPACAQSIMAKLVADNKIIYDDGIVGIINYHKHNRLINNPKYQIAIRKSLSKYGLGIQEKFCSGLGIDWVSIGYPSQSPNINTNTKVKINDKTKVLSIKTKKDSTPNQSTEQPVSVEIAKPKTVHLVNSSAVRDDGRSEWARGVWLSDKEWDGLCEDYGDTEVWEGLGIAETQYLSDNKPKNAPYVRAILKRRREEADGKYRKRA